MPLIDDETIDSLRAPDGRWTHFALFLLGAVAIDHRGISPADPVPSESEWRPRVLCSKIPQSRLHAIRHQAKYMHLVPKRTPKPRRHRRSHMIRHLRKLVKRAALTISIIDQILSEAK